MKKEKKKVLTGFLICLFGLGVIVLLCFVSGVFNKEEGSYHGTAGEEEYADELEGLPEFPGDKVAEAVKPEPTAKPAVGADGNTKSETAAEPTATPTATPTPEPTPTPDPNTLPTEGDISFSLAGHYYSEDTEIEITDTTGKPGIIVYTTDGKSPKKNGKQYTEPLLLEAGGDDFPKVYSIRAKAFYDDGTESTEYVHNYVVSENAKTRYTTMVMFINGNPAELIDGPSGILYGTNYSSSGKKSERVIQIEAVSADDSLLFSQFAGVRVFGGGSRQWSIKSLKLYARKDYDPENGTFKFSGFGTKKLDEEDKIIKKYDKLVLRNAGDDFGYSFIRDEFSMRLVELGGFDTYEAVVPAVCYINGKYYGFYWLHESYCDEYFQQRFGKSDGEYIVLEGCETGKSVSGNSAEQAAAREYNSIYSKYKNADFTNDETYNALNSLIDVENYLDYMAFNICVGNADWPQGNYKCYRYYSNNGVYETAGGDAASNGEAASGGDTANGGNSEPSGGEAVINARDGRWRFLMHDSDIGYGTYREGKSGGANVDDFKAVIYNSSNKRYAPLLHSLLKRRECFDYFVNKVQEYLNTILDYDFASSVLDSMCAERDTELDYYIKHFDSVTTGERTEASRKTVDYNITKIKTFLFYRKDYAKEFVGELAGVYGFPAPEWQ